MAPEISRQSSQDSTIRRQHDTLNSLLTAISGRFEHSHVPSRNLVSLLNALAFHLQTHFEFEEADCYFTNLVQTAPRTAQIVEKILQEHREMLVEVDQMVQEARADLDHKSGTDALARRYAKFREKLEAHEHQENLLLQDVYTEDIGTKD